MPSSKPRITIYIDEEELQFLKEWAGREDRSLNNLTLRIIKQAIALAKMDLGRSDQLDVDLAIPQTQMQATAAFLKILASGQKPSDAQVLITARRLGLEPEILIALRDHCSVAKQLENEDPKDELS
jgi:hypothetical protein